MMRGIRGAITVQDDQAEELGAATKQLLTQMMNENQLTEEHLVSVMFTSTPDLRASFPAAAARELGLTDTPLFSAQEVDVAGAVPRCIRVLMLVETDCSKADIRHVYLNEAVRLRPDWVRKGEDV